MIESWLEQFHNAWKAHDISAVMSLFTENVEYWETPQKLLSGKDSVLGEWQTITEQQDIQASWDIYNSANNRHTVIWKLQYKKLGKTYRSSGIYLITLDDQGLCNYFYYIGQGE